MVLFYVYTGFLLFDASKWNELVWRPYRSFVNLSNSFPHISSKICVFPSSLCSWAFSCRAKASLRSSDACNARCFFYCQRKVQESVMLELNCGKSCVKWKSLPFTLRVFCFLCSIQMVQLLWQVWCLFSGFHTQTPLLFYISPAVADSAFQSPASWSQTSMSCLTCSWWHRTQTWQSGSFQNERWCTSPTKKPLATNKNHYQKAPTFWKF